MLHHRISDWDDAYANSANIPRSERWPGAWEAAAEAFRAEMSSAGRARLDLTYGDRTRNRLDLFLPDGEPSGLMVFVHGGYWLGSDRKSWSHLAKGAVAHGFAAALPSYTLCPDIRVSGIVEEIARSIEQAAAQVDGPIVLTGHSAGGHLVTRMIAVPSPLSTSIQARIRNCVSISGLHDLRPLLCTEMNARLRLDEAEAVAQSPALLRPLQHVRLTCWAGGAERSEFLRQNALLASIWRGLGSETAAVVEPDRHHYNVVDALAEPGHALLRALLTV